MQKFVMNKSMKTASQAELRFEFLPNADAFIGTVTR
jgi:hypothetical protein